jgi:hypothetical protein
VSRVQLGVCVSQIVKHDFPGKWPQIVEKISIYLQTPDPAGQKMPDIMHLFLFKTGICVNIGPKTISPPPLSFPKTILFPSVVDPKIFFLLRIRLHV